MKIADVRRYALSLPEAAEEPHFQYASFRVRGKIFATVPTEKDRLHIFVPEEDREPVVAAHPDAFEKLWWGKKVIGVRVTLSKAATADVKRLLRAAWRKKAPKALRDADA
jgi:hypothetical protein